MKQVGWSSCEYERDLEVGYLGGLPSGQPAPLKEGTNLCIAKLDQFEDIETVMAFQSLLEPPIPS